MKIKTAKRNMAINAAPTPQYDKFIKAIPLENYSAEDYGSMTITPAEVYAGESVELRFIYQAGSKGIKKNNGIKIKIPLKWSSSDWSLLKARGVKAASCVNIISQPGHVKIKVEMINKIPRGDWIYLTVKEGNVKKNDAIVISYKTKAPTFTTGKCPFAVIYGLQGDKNDKIDWRSYNRPGGPTYERMLDRVSYLKITGGKPCFIHFALQQIIAPGKEFHIRISILDKYHNLASESFDGVLTIKTSAPIKGDTKIKFAASDANIKIAGPFKIEKPGKYTISVAGLKLDAESLPLICDKSISQKIFWGDLHGHSEFSDGIGRPDEYFSFARDASLLDFSALTDHDDGLISPYTEMDNKLTDKCHEISRAASCFNDPGRFVTFPAYEWACDGGHRNIYFLNDGDWPVLSRMDGKYQQPENLYKKLKEIKQSTPVMVIQHTHGNYTDWASHDTELEYVAEIVSDKGDGESWNPADRFQEWSDLLGCDPSNFSKYENKDGRKQLKKTVGGVRKALYMGAKLGLNGGSDYHTNMPGRTVPLDAKSLRGGYFAICANELSRGALWNSIKERSCYATTGARMLLSFRLNNAGMGQEIRSAGKRVLKITVGGTAPIKKIEFIRNGAVIHAKEINGDKRFISYSWADEEEFGKIAIRNARFNPKPFAFYYVRIFQADNEIAWSSPIWVRSKNRGHY